MLAQKIVVIISITFIHDPNGLLCLFLFLFFIFIIIQIIMQPFNDKGAKNQSLHLNSLQLYCYFTNFLIVFFCLCLKFRVYDWEVFFYLTLIVVCNMAFLFQWGFMYLRESKTEFELIKKFIAQKTKIIATKFPRLFRCLKSVFHAIYDRSISPGQRKHRKHNPEKGSVAMPPKTKEFVKSFNH